MKYLLLALITLTQLCHAQVSDKYFAQSFGTADTLKYKDSVALFTKLIAQHPEAASLYAFRGYYKMGLKQFRSSITDYQQALQLQPDYLAAAQSAGTNYFFLHHYDTAEIYFKQALKLAPSDSDAKYMLGYTLYELKRYDEAASYFSTCKHTGVFAQNAINMTGHCWLLAKNYTATLAYFDSLLLRKPNRPDYLCYKARALSGLNQYGKALATFDRCLSQNKLFTDAYYYRAQTHLALGNKQAAGKDYYQAALLGDVYARDILCIEYKSLCHKLHSAEKK